ncbi:hypothetical protein [Arthrobacter roseus]|uniref:hypothetical protein n=1 Tax=Arthrobacter roseus TaxID=136274 RepID=UPI0019660965|nr:hypothetical protein [Arthrobacter roseus]MBM7847455.1 hypothetical protein [Arthrobacter roseus]
MSVYLGQLGRLVELKCPSGEAQAPEDTFTFEQTLEGRVKAQSRAFRGRRRWAVDIGVATPADVGALMAFADGEWGHGPFLWISTDTPVTNMLTPEQASCDPSVIYGANESAGGPVETPDGWAGRSYVNSTPASLMYFGFDYTPVIPGEPVTASAYVRGAGAAARLYFYDSSGNWLGAFVTSTVTATAGIVVRSWVTATAPAGAASCRVLGVNTSQGERPAITWTDGLFEWSAGNGCSKAVIHGLSRQVILALREPGYGRYSSPSFTIQEVG